MIRSGQTFDMRQRRVFVSRRRRFLRDQRFDRNFLVFVQQEETSPSQ